MHRLQAGVPSHFFFLFLQFMRVNVFNTSIGRDWAICLNSGSGSQTQCFQPFAHRPHVGFPVHFFLSPLHLTHDDDFFVSSLNRALPIHLFINMNQKSNEYCVPIIGALEYVGGHIISWWAKRKPSKLDRCVAFRLVYSGIRIFAVSSHNYNPYRTLGPPFRLRVVIKTLTEAQYGL